jgi:hypothetical protein
MDEELHRVMMKWAIAGKRHFQATGNWIVKAIGERPQNQEGVKQGLRSASELKVRKGSRNWRSKYISDIT